MKIHYVSMILYFGQIKSLDRRKYHGLVDIVHGQANYIRDNQRLRKKEKTIMTLPEYKTCFTKPWFENTCIILKYDLLDVSDAKDTLNELEIHETYCGLFRYLKRKWHTRRLDYHARSISLFNNINTFYEQTITCCQNRSIRNLRLLTQNRGM